MYLFDRISRQWFRVLESFLTMLRYSPFDHQKEKYLVFGLSFKTSLTLFI